MPGVSAELAAQLLKKGECIELIVFGESMWPLLRAGEKVCIDPKERPRLGALGGALLDGRLCVHRIVGIENDRIELLGDNGGSLAKIPVDSLLGVVRSRWTREGRKRLEGRLPQLFDEAVARVSRRTRIPWKIAYRMRARLGALLH